MTEYTWFDEDGNGTYEAGYADTDGDGWYDVAAIDLNGDTLVDAYRYDSDRDGIIGDELRVDADHDGLADLIAYDSNEDTVSEGYASAQTGWAYASVDPTAGFTSTTMPMQGAYASSDPAGFTSTTMPMQGAYWSGVNGESTAMTFTRLLQTETNPLTQVMLANAITMSNVIAMDNPFLD